ALALRRIGAAHRESGRDHPALARELTRHGGAAGSPEGVAGLDLIC
ncbi:hypothetical protein GT040_06660, partial [Streptomyces sp. SID2119]|nr:hypothetical protein [Streptomyces sp. SID2119]